MGLYDYPAATRPVKVQLEPLYENDAEKTIKLKLKIESFTYDW